MNGNAVRYLTYILTALALSVMALSSHQAVSAEGEGQTVYFIPLEKTVEQGLYHFLNRAISTAEDEGADHIVLEVNTPGGAVEAATEITKRLTETEIPITAFINKKALSAGAYISLNADQIVMVPGATMGSAAIIDQAGNAADKKSQSFWLAEMKTSAEQHNRDPVYAMAMADESIDLPEYGAGKGKLLTLTANQALEVGYAEHIVESRAALLELLELEDAAVEEINETLAEKIARFITHPVVVPILLSVGSLGLVLELYSPGFGIPGTMGLAALILFFYGHLVAGLAGMEAIILLIAGVIMIVLEVFVPGGILGLIGIGAIIGSLFLSTGDVGNMMISILIAIAVSATASVIMFKRFGANKGIFRKIILSDSTNTEQGYVSNRTRLELIGLEGRSITPLRPSGTGIFDGERIDVVSEGGYIASDKPIKIVRTEGSRVIVREQS